MTSTDTPPSTSPTSFAGPSVVRGLDWAKSTWVLLVVLCGALFLDGLDLSMVGVALPSIGSDLHLSASSLQWIVSGYVLGYGSFLLLGGRAADLIGRRPVFLAAVAVFGVASVVSAGLSNDFALIALRFVKGASAGFTVPAGLSIITTTFAEGPARNRALSIYTVCGASGFSLGLVFGGLLTELGWRETFLVPGPVALVLLFAGIKVIPKATRDRVALAHFDLAGAFTSTASLLLLVYAVVEAPIRGWGDPATIGFLVGAVVLMAAFVVVEKRHERPLVRLGILRSRSLVHANLAGAAMFGGYVAFQFLVTLYVQNSLGWSPLGMAMAFLPAGALVAASSTKMSLVLARVSTPVLIAVGLTSLLAGYLLFLRVGSSHNYANFLLPTILLLGLGFALTFPAVNVQATSGVADHEQGLASGLLNTAIQVGGAVVLAVVTAILTASGKGKSIASGDLLPGTMPALAVIVGVSVAGLLYTLVRVRAERPAVAPAEEYALAD